MGTIDDASSEYFVATDAWAMRASPVSMIWQCLCLLEHFVYGYTDRKYDMRCHEQWEFQNIVILSAPICLEAVDFGIKECLYSKGKGKRTATS